MKENQTSYTGRNWITEFQISLLLDLFQGKRRKCSKSTGMAVFEQNEKHLEK